MGFCPGGFSPVTDIYIYMYKNIHIYICICVNVHMILRDQSQVTTLPFSNLIIRDFIERRRGSSSKVRRSWKNWLRVMFCQNFGVCIYKYEYIDIYRHT